MSITSPGMSISGIEDVLGFYGDVWTSAPVARRHFVTNTSIDELTVDEASVVRLQHLDGAFSRLLPVLSANYSLCQE